MLTDEEIQRIDAWWRAANYLSAGQIYLRANPLLRTPLRREDIKPRLLGHWGTSPGLNFCYAHLNRAIATHDLDMIYVMGPGHGGPAAVANAWLEGTYSEVYLHVSQGATGMGRLFRQFSYPGGIPSHVAPETPGSIHEGGELGYSLAHAYGAAFDNPDLIVACIVGDGEAETGPLATSWHSNKFLDPVRDGAVLPILHLNGYKIANPAVLARISEKELIALLEGYGHRPILVSGDDPATMHQAMAAALEEAVGEITRIRCEAREAEIAERPGWPMIVLRTPKGWTGPKVVDGLPVEGTWRAHQVPLANVRDDPSHLAQLEAWLKSYRPEELFDADGRPAGALAPAPIGARRMSANPHANGGLLLRDLDLPDFRTYAIAVDGPGVTPAEPTRTLGAFLRDVIAANAGAFRITGPDETTSNRLSAVFEVTDRAWQAGTLDTDEHLGPHGHVMEVLSEHLCQGWLEGYLLTGRHGLFNSYEAFIHIVDAMFNQHAKWLETCRKIPWRRPIASLNYLLSSHVWRQDHNGFTHQDPGFLDVVMNKKAEVVLACAGDIPTLETLAAADLLRRYFPDLRVRVVNVVDLMRLQPDGEHPHGLSDAEFDALFTTDRPVIFAFHGYPYLIHRLTYRRHGHHNLHVRGYKEEGTTTTPFDMVMLNDLDRFHLVMDVIDRVPSLGGRVAHIRQKMADQRLRARAYTREHGEDVPEISAWTWPQAGCTA
jgi:xylulose-5-phosphate/fructose-6-phosphate phosphoketolase